MADHRRVLKALRSVACPHCGAGNDGEQCVTRTGRHTSSIHQARYYQAVRAGVLPLDQEYLEGITDG